MNQSVRIKAVLPSGAIEEVAISPSCSPPWTLNFSGLGMRDHTFSGTDLFGALVALRRHLEGMGYRLLCAGARRDVYPSGMARAMGSARKAYVFELGKPAQDVVDIFAQAQLEQVGTVDEQEQFRQEWIGSLRKKMK
jgi:hypothetical protein